MRPEPARLGLLHDRCRRLQLVSVGGGRRRGGRRGAGGGGNDRLSEGRRPPASAHARALLSAVAHPRSCFPSPRSVFWGSNQLTAGLAFSIMAWLVEFLALLLGLLCIVESSNSTLSSGRLLDWERMPVVLFITVVAICFRCVALGCLYNCASRGRALPPSRHTHRHARTRTPARLCATLLLHSLPPSPAMQTSSSRCSTAAAISRVW